MTGPTLFLFGNRLLLLLVKKPLLFHVVLVVDRQVFPQLIKIFVYHHIKRINVVGKLCDVLHLAVVLEQLLFASLNTKGGQAKDHFHFLELGTEQLIYPAGLFGLLIVVGAAYRLAKFNVDERQTSGFIGLPTPANAIFIASLVMIMESFSPAWAYELLSNEWVLLGITIASSLIMNSEIRLFALKFKSFGFKENWYKYGFLLLSALALLLFKIIAVPFIIIGYILFSIVLNQTSKS